MNIMLADLSSFTLDQADPSLAPQADASGFAGMFSRQFPLDPGKDSQGIDTEGFLEKLPVLVDSAELTPGQRLVASSTQYPLADPAGISADADAIAELVVGGVQPGLKPEAAAMRGAPRETTQGELLPAGGKILPANAEPGIAQRGLLDKPGASSATAASASSTVRSAASATLAQTVLQTSTVDTGKDVPLSRETGGISEKPAAAADFVALMNKSAMAENAPRAILTRKDVTAETTPAVAKESVPNHGPAAEAKQPGVADAMRNPEFRAALAASRAEGGLAVAPQSWAAAPAVPAEGLLNENQRVVRGPREAVNLDINAAREATAERIVASVDKLMATAGSAGREMPGSVELRNPDITAQLAATTQQPAHNLSAGTAHSAAVPIPTLANLAQPGALPPQLETLTLARTADSAEWSNSLGERVNWMINQKQNTATIRLDPPHLGKLDVHIKISDDATTVSFLTQHGQTRDLIESASVRLRDFLQENGYQNVNVDVSQRQDQQQARSQAGFDNDDGHPDESHQEQVANQAEREQASYFIGDGIVDTFA
jgi:flagellar hook-length control protein FliK